eukprot:1978345-Pleurochrysis_carterae.AAC.1
MQSRSTRAAGKRQARPAERRTASNSSQRGWVVAGSPETFLKVKRSAVQTIHVGSRPTSRNWPLRQGGLEVASKSFGVAGGA